MTFVASVTENPFARMSEYDMRHLLRHLAESGRAKDIHRLLRISHASDGSVANAWFGRRRDRLEVGSYIEDLDLAWGLADDAGVHGDAFVLHTQYLLMSASVNSLVALLPAGVPAVRDMAPAQAVVLARRHPDVQQRAEALLQLLPHLSGPSLDEAAVAVLVLIGSLPTRSDRSAVMTRLVPHLPGDRVPLAIEIARGFPDDERIVMLSLITPALAGANFEGLVAEAIAQFRTARSGRQLFDHERNKERDRSESEAVELLRALLPRIAALGRPDRALSLATDLLLPPVPGRLVPLFAPNQPDHTRSYIWTVQAMMPYLPLDDVRHVIAELEHRSPDERDRQWLLGAWSERLAETGLYEEAVAVAADLADGRDRIETLAGLLTLIPGRHDRIRVVAMIVELSNDPSTGHFDRHRVGDSIAALWRRAGPGTRVRVLAHLLRSRKLAGAALSARVRAVVVNTASQRVRRRSVRRRDARLHREADEAERAVVQAVRDSLVDGAEPEGRPRVWRRAGSGMVEGYGRVVTAIPDTPGDTAVRIAVFPDWTRWVAAAGTAIHELRQHKAMGEAIRAGVEKLLDDTRRQTWPAFARS